MSLSCIWYWRNKDEHIEDFVRLYNPNLHVSLHLKDYGEALAMDNMVVERTKEVSLINWTPHRSGMVKLNMDGACIEGVTAGCGGLVRNEEGFWMGGFSKNVGNCSNYMAEL